MLKFWHACYNISSCVVVIGDSQSRCQNGWNRSRSPSPPEFGSEREKELLRRKYRYRKLPYYLSHTFRTKSSEFYGRS